MLFCFLPKEKINIYYSERNRLSVFDKHFDHESWCVLMSLLMMFRNYYMKSLSIVRHDSRLVLSKGIQRACCNGDLVNRGVFSS